MRQVLEKDNEHSSWFAASSMLTTDTKVPFPPTLDSKKS
jgi:hypothetical protein